MCFFFVISSATAKCNGVYHLSQPTASSVISLMERVSSAKLRTASGHSDLVQGGWLVCHKTALSVWQNRRPPNVGWPVWLATADKWKAPQGFVVYFYLTAKFQPYLVITCLSNLVWLELALSFHERVVGWSRRTRNRCGWLNSHLEACFSKVPRTFRARKASCQSAFRFFWKANLWTCLYFKKKTNKLRELWHPN